MAQVSVTYGAGEGIFVNVEMRSKVRSPEMLSDLKARAMEAFAEALTQAGFIEAAEEVQSHTVESLTAMVGDLKFSGEEE